MGLSLEEIKSILEEKPRAGVLEKARKHESRLRFHGETILNKSELPDAYTDFLAWVGGTVDGSDTHPRLLPPSKFKRFKQLFSTPVETVEIIDSTFTKLNRVFDAQDAIREMKFKKDGVSDEFFDFFNPHEYWKTKGEVVKTSINSVWVADLPEVETDPPEPYGYIIDISSVLDIMNDEDNNCQWLIFALKGSSYKAGDTVSNDYILVYDDESIRKFTYPGGELGEEVVNSLHGLDYTPARMIWTDRLEKGDNINKKSPVTSVLNALDNYLFMSTNRRYMELANSYPITVAYDTRGEAPSDNKNDNKADSIKNVKGNDLLGPGTLTLVPPPLPGEVDMMTNPVQIVSPDVNSLEYHAGKLEKMKEAIFTAIVGAEDDRTNDQAKNEMQVQSAVESREEVLSKYKRNFEIIEEFSTKTLAQLRYEGQFEDYSVDYGSEFFLRSMRSLQTEYREALEAGSDPVVLEQIKNNILDYKYRNNPSGRKRADIITDLTPYRDKTLQDIIQFYKEGMGNEMDITIRINLLDFVAKFERENAPIDIFAEKMDYRRKLEKIRATFEQYAQEKLEARKDPVN